MKKVIIILGFLGLIIFGGLSAKRKYFDSNQPFEKVKAQIKQLTDQVEIKNGDIIFRQCIKSKAAALN